MAACSSSAWQITRRQLCKDAAAHGRSLQKPPVLTSHRTQREALHSRHSIFLPASTSLLQTRTMSSTPPRKALTIDKVNPQIKEAKYAVRGELAIRSEKYRTQLRKLRDNPPTPPSESDLPFDSIISANIGNPQQLDQKPITFFRQVLSLLENPQLLEHEEILRHNLNYQQDVIDRARWLLREIGSVGAYSQSDGVPAIRQSIANYIQRRDGFPADPTTIYMSAGASSGVNTLMNIICAHENVGVLVPIPQYPLYTATLAVLNARCVPYYLDESKGWGTDLNIIKESYREAKEKGYDMRAIVVINPGNPTGGSLPRKDIEAILTFAAENDLVVFADEVYQTNTFIGEFISFKKVLREMQRDNPGHLDHVILASLHSISKGMVGECGHRGGYFEIIGLDKEVHEQIYKFIAIMLCPPVIGQCLVEMMVNPPVEGDPSYPLYRHEYDTIKNNLQTRATALYKAFQEMEGVEIGEPQGSMYLFPTIRLPERAIQAARSAGKNPDDFYCLELLDATGICVVPGSGFGQKEGTLHFRTTFLAPGTEWVGRITEFHRGFMDKYR